MKRQDLKIGNLYKTDVEKIVNGGLCLSRIDGCVVFYKNAAPEEYVEIKIVEKKKNFYYAELVKIITPSIYRIEPPCPYFDKCGGCQFQYMKYDYQLKVKDAIIKELLGDFTHNIRKIHESDSVFNYRNKVRFRKQDDCIGLLRQESNDVVDIDKCLIANHKINNIYSGLKNEVKNNSNDVVFTLRTSSKSELMLHSDKSINMDSYIENSIDSIYFGNNCVKGQKFIVEELFDTEYPVFPDSFFQVNNKVIKEIISYIKGKLFGDFLIDAYCGTGIFSFSLRDNFKNTLGIDISNSSIRSANAIKKRYDINDSEFYTGNVVNFIESLKKADSLIVDPPRKGCSKEFINAVKRSKIKNMVYLSCDPATLQRDLRSLSGVFSIDEVIPFDMFPQTYHVETLCLLTRK